MERSRSGVPHIYLQAPNFCRLIFGAGFHDEI
jgi:hypothetical protein